jgi:hypothetical protein
MSVGHLQKFAIEKPKRPIQVLAAVSAEEVRRAPLFAPSANQRSRRPEAAGTGEANVQLDQVEQRNRSMGDVTLHDDFVVLTGAHAVSPTLKIAVRLGRWDLEMNGVQEVIVDYDPQIDAARLMMPESESPYHVPSQYDPPEPAMIPFFSRDRVDVTRFGFGFRVEGDTLIFFCGYDDHSARLKTKASERLPVSAIKENSAAFLYLVLHTIGRLKDWPDVVPGLSDPRRIEIRISSTFLDALERSSGLTLPMAAPGECLIARWELGA